MSKAIELAVRSAVESIVDEMGFELADVEYKKETRDVDGWVLTVFIYTPSGVNIENCEAVSRAIEPIIDELDLVDSEYFLSVSSLGLDRPFKSVRDYERFLEEEIEVRLYAPINKRKEFVGILKQVDAQQVSIMTVPIFVKGKLDKGGMNITFTANQIALARPYIRFDEDDKDNTILYD